MKFDMLRMLSLQSLTLKFFYRRVCSAEKKTDFFAELPFLLTPASTLHTPAAWPGLLRFLAMTPTAGSSRTFACYGSLLVYTIFWLSTCNFMTRCGLHENDLFLSREPVPPDFQMYEMFYGKGGGGLPWRSDISQFQTITNVPSALDNLPSCFQHKSSGRVAHYMTRQQFSNILFRSCIFYVLQDCCQR